MIQSKQVLEWQAQALNDGLISLLEDRLGSLPITAVEQVRSMRDVVVLQRWLKLAARATSLDQFLQDSGVTTIGT